MLVAILLRVSQRNAQPRVGCAPGQGEFLTCYLLLTSYEDAIMLWTIAVILFILWILGFFVVHVGGGLIHILLVIAVIVIIYRLVTGRPVV
jgi:hypothetical protein